MEALNVSGLSKSFLCARVVDDLSLTIEAGEIYGFIGHNGAGKSTVMKMLCGMLLPASGEIEIFGERIAPGCSSRKIGTLIEKPGIHPGLSGFDNVMCRALALGVVSPKAKSLEALAFVGLKSAANKRAKTYSLGMQQRLGLALALVGSPDLLLLDEPFNGLDPEGVRSIRNLILKLNRVRGVTVFISSHVLDQLERMVTRYGVIREGRLVSEISSEEVEQECADYLCAHCSNPELALAAFQKAHLPATFTLMEDNTIRIAGDVDAEDISKILAHEGIPISALYRHARDIEDFFVELMGDSAASPNTLLKGASPRTAKASTGGGADA